MFVELLLDTGTLMESNKGQRLRGTIKDRGIEVPSLYFLVTCSCSGKLTSAPAPYFT